MGKFVDPLKITCPGCGREALHPLASVRALQAECTFCHQSLRDAGERIIAFEREVQNDAIAMAIEMVIEKLDHRIQFRTEDLKDWHPVCLNDVVGQVARILEALPPANDRLSAERLVEAAIKEMVPSIDCPSKHLPMVDVFADHIEAMWAYHFKGWKRVERDAPKVGSS